MFCFWLQAFVPRSSYPFPERKIPNPQDWSRLWCGIPLNDVEAGDRGPEGDDGNVGDERADIPLIPLQTQHSLSSG